MLLVRALIISDLHANLEALRRLPSDFDQLWVLGDLVNYGPNPAEVIDYIRDRASVVIRGNHDHSAGFHVDPQCSARFRAMAEETGAYTRSVLNSEHRNYLRSLPLTASLKIDGVGFFLCHAAPPHPLFEYRPEDSPLWLADEVGPDVRMVLAGHTHRPFHRILPARAVVNPGSAGQPKHGRAEACFAFWEDGRLTPGSVPYDVETTIGKLRKLCLSAAVFEDLAFVLRTGRVPPEPEFRAIS